MKNHFLVPYQKSKKLVANVAAVVSYKDFKRAVYVKFIFSVGFWKEWSAGEVKLGAVEIRTLKELFILILHFQLEFRKSDQLS